MTRSLLWHLLWLSLVLSAASTAEAVPITASAGGCVSQNTGLPSEFTWTYGTHFQAVVFHDPVAGCGETIYLRSDWLLDWAVDYDGAGGLRVTSKTAKLPTCGRLQFDMHTYLPTGELDPMGLVSLVVDLGSNCGGRPVTPEPPETPVPVPDPASGVLVLTGIAVICLGRRWTPANRPARSRVA